MADEGAFVKTFQAEMKVAQHSALVELYIWANRKHYGRDVGLERRAEEWAKRVEESGKAHEVLWATADKTQ